ncbi:MAG TPA: hypothetical protein VK253_00080, partial [Candidatus Binatia bacterium]|nr:hypothetical protein [Candidatus Binatia bacterium]
MRLPSFLGEFGTVAESAYSPSAMKTSDRIYGKGSVELSCPGHCVYCHLCSSFGCRTLDRSLQLFWIYL